MPYRKNEYAKARTTRLLSKKNFHPYLKELDKPNNTTTDAHKFGEEYQM